MEKNTVAEKLLPAKEAQMPEATCSNGDGEDSEIENEVENSHLTQNHIVEEQSGTITEQAILQEHTEHDTIKVDGSEAEEVIATSLDRDMLNNTSGDSQEQPIGDCAMVVTPQRIESDRDCAVEIPVTVFLEVEREQLRTSVLNMADQLGNVCIEMDNVLELERNDSTENSCDKSASDTTKILYFSEGESTDVESDVCRICHCSEEMEILISPCLCTGSVKFVHHSCLMNWLQRAVMSKCELCLYPLAVKRKRKPFSKWRLPEDKPFPILWLFTFVVAMTLNVASIAKDGSQRCVSNPCIIFYVLGSAGALLGLAFFYHWLRKTLRYIAKWIALNQEWTLVGPIDLRSHLGQTNLAYSSKSLSETDETVTQDPSGQVA